MDQKRLLDTAKQQQGLTSDYELAQRLGVGTGRVSQLRSGIRDAEMTEIFMLADMAGIDPHAAAAAIKKGKEKNPAKRAYWEKIAAQFAMTMLLITLVFTGAPSEAHASESGFTKLQIMRIYGLSKQAPETPRRT